MWRDIEFEIKAKIGENFTLKTKQQVCGGDSHSSYIIGDDNEFYFVKYNTLAHLDMFATEARALKEITHTQTIKTPKLISTGSNKEHAYIILEYLNMSDNAEMGWQHFGEQLAGLHLSDTQAMFGWDENNYIGKTPQVNIWHKKWCHFFAEQRIAYQLQLLQEKGHRLCDIDDFTSLVKQHLASRKINASLLHGDLWRGNVGFYDGAPVIFDPASYFGDYEVDIAMSELFGRLPPEFYQAYYSVTPLEDDYENRKAIYNLYHLLNHANLFAGNYLSSAQKAIERILAF